jgi:hypothetical protein
MNVGNETDLSLPTLSKNLRSLKNEMDPKILREASNASTQLTVSGIPLQALVSDLAPQKKYNTADYEYVQQLKDKHKRAEISRKVELERELREFRKAKQRIATQSGTMDNSQSTIVKPTISKSVSSIIKIRPKNKQ